MIGRRLGPWKLLRQFGGGAFGAVFEAEHVVIVGRRAAVKVLHAHLALQPGIKQRFLNEASAASRAEHENIVQMFDAGISDDGLCYVAMELLHGSTLAELVQPGPLGADRTGHIGLQAAEALAAAHAIQIVHRDLKPDNVYIVRRANNPEFVKILDFGIAKLQQPGGDGNTLTGAGMVLGTPGYMSPEQWMTLPDIDGRADIYALGIILFQCLTGSLPFTATTPYQWLKAHLEQPPPDLSRLDGVPPVLGALVGRMLAKDRNERPQSMEEVAATLKGAQRPSQWHSSSETRTALQPMLNFEPASSSGSGGPGGPNRPTTASHPAPGARKPLVTPTTPLTVSNPIQTPGPITISMPTPTPTPLATAMPTPTPTPRPRPVPTPMLVVLPTPLPAPLRLATPMPSFVVAGDRGGPVVRKSRRRFYVGLAVVMAMTGMVAIVKTRAPSAEQVALTVAQLSRETERAMKEMKWDRAMATCDEALRLAPHDDAFSVMKTRALFEKANQRIFDELKKAHAVEGGDAELALVLYQQLPESSAYHVEAEALHPELQAAALEKRLNALRGLMLVEAPSGCDEANEKIGAVFELDPSNAEALGLQQSCEARRGAADISATSKRAAAKEAARAEGAETGSDQLIPAGLKDPFGVRMKRAAAQEPAALLLGQAQSHLAKQEFVQAIDRATAANLQAGSELPRAMKIIALAYCHLKDKHQALAAWSKLESTDKLQIEYVCNQYGVDLGSKIRVRESLPTQ